MQVLLLSTYELGRPSFALASAAAWLNDSGHNVTCVDASKHPIPDWNGFDLIGFSLPMHTATRLAAPLIADARRSAPGTPIVCFGLYAALNHGYLRELGANSILGGEFEADLARVAEGQTINRTSLDRLRFKTPAARDSLHESARLVVQDERRLAGYTEASRGCKHLCRHCPVVPVYGGAFRVVQTDVVLSDIRQQIGAGAKHITFGDPDFFNGPTHARRIIQRLHMEFPDVTYDVTIKVEHLLKHRNLLPLLRDTGCLFITSAAESLDDIVLQKLEKGHTRSDFLTALELCRDAGVAMVPTFIPFTPWTTLASHRDFLLSLVRLDLVETVPSVQLALRLLIPAGSRMPELPEVCERIEHYDAEALLYRWRHGDSRVDQLAQESLRQVHRGQRAGLGRRAIFANLWSLVSDQRLPEDFEIMPRATVPYLDEPWYC